MTLITYRFLIDQDNDGDFYATIDDVTSRVLSRSTVRLTRGLDSIRTGSPPMAGELNGLEIQNADKVYSSQNGASALFGKLKPGRRVEFQATLASDTFTRADSPSSLGTADLGGAWSALQGTWGISSNQAYLVATDGTNRAAAVLDTGTADGTIQVTFANLQDGNRLVFRATDALNQWTVEVDSTSMILSKIVASVGTIVANIAGTFVSGDKMRVELFGPSIKVFQNATLLTAQTDTFQQTATKHGIGASSSGTMPTARFDDFAVRRPLMNGLTRTYKENAHPSKKSVDLTALGMLSQLAKAKGQGNFSLLYQDVRVDQAMGYLLDAIGLTDTRYRVFDVCDTILRWWWLGPDEDPLEAAFQLARSEDGLLFEDGLGRLVLRNKFSPDTDARRSVSQVTIRDASPNEPRFSEVFELSQGHDEIINDVQFAYKRREIQSLQQVWSLGALLTLAPNQTVNLDVTANDPFTGAVNPGAPTDYVVLSGSVSSSTLGTGSGSKAVLTITAGSGGATITGPAGAEAGGIRVRAQPATVVETRTIGPTVSTAASKAEFGPHVYPYAVRAEIDSFTLEGLADRIVTKRKDPRPTLVYRIVNANATRVAEILAREIGDRVKVTEAQTTLSDAEFFVTQIDHEINQGGGVHATTFGLEKADAAQTLFRLGVSQLSGTHKLG